MSQQVKKRPVFARMYTGPIRARLERAGVDEHRRRLVAGLIGEVLEIGAGDGSNFGHYPAQVARVAAIEPEPTLRSHAQQAAAAAAVPITVTGAAAERLPYQDNSFDAVVACLTLCSVSDQHAALAEAHRVLRPGGQLRIFEHVRAETPMMRRVQRVLDATVWPPLVGGCHTGRDTLSAITAAGFVITELDRFRFPDTKFPSPTADHVLGTAIAHDEKLS